MQAWPDPSDPPDPPNLSGTPPAIPGRQLSVSHHATWYTPLAGRRPVGRAGRRAGILPIDD
eukprot:353206-Chlamydomonas_euryale.AAC.18